jgi:tRNA/tmRNA/rRNA uracil-C5-methylase (TrmA/RlmC/RlmD family)
VVPVADCLIAEEAIRAVLAGLQKMPTTLSEHIKTIRLETFAGKVDLLAVTNRHYSDENRQGFLSFCLNEIKVSSISFQCSNQDRNELSEGVDEISRLGHFSQVNNAGNEALKSLVASLVSQKSALELYAGSGNFSFLLAEKGIYVRAVELDPTLVKLGKTEALRRAMPVDFVRQSAEEYCADATSEPLLFLDPPRAGAFEALKALNLERCEQIVYVSCDLGSLSRDLALLQDRGFVCEDVFVVDMFPQTNHVECVANLSRGSSGNRVL